LNDAGIPAERVPLSGAAGGSYTGDIVIEPMGDAIRVEVKARKDGAGFKVLEEWKGNNDLLILKRNYHDPMVVLDWKLFLDIMQLYLDVKAFPYIKDEDV
tara:strand:- start:4406 stop:4705 length:300 start_codon:yes stop_codon:yes gene_type:complete